MEVQILSSDAFTYSCGAAKLQRSWVCPINLLSRSLEVQSVFIILACATVLQCCMCLCFGEFWTFYVPSVIFDYSL